MDGDIKELWDKSEKADAANMRMDKRLLALERETKRSAALNRKTTSFRNALADPLTNRTL